MPTLAEQLLEAAADADRRAEHHRHEATRYEHMAALLRSQAAGEQERLTTGEERSIIGSKMQLDTTGQPRNVRIAATRTRSKSKAKRALLKAGLTDQAVAAKFKVGRSTVNAWFSGRRAIPESFVEALSKEHGIPRSAWPRIA